MNWQELVKNLFDDVQADNHVKLENALKNFQNPLNAEGIIFKTKESSKLLGGGGEVQGINQSVVLGGGRCGSIVTFNVNGSATVQFEMWFPLAQIPAGAWTVGGPGSSGPTQLNCNVVHRNPPGCPEWFGQPVTIKAKGINGTFPVNVTFNP